MTTLVKNLAKRGIILAPKLTFKSTTPLDAETAALLKDHKVELLQELIAPKSIPRLPRQLERLLCAASSNVLPSMPVQLPGGVVHDLNTHTMAWGCSYLTGDRSEALARLWAAYNAWQKAS